MNRLVLACLILAAAGSPVVAQGTEAVTPDVATFVDQELILPGQTTSLFLADEFTAASDLVGDGVDALHRLTDPGRWLFSVVADAPESLTGMIDSPPDGFVAKGDVIFFDKYDNDGAGKFSLFFCGLESGQDISPARGNYDVDSVFLDGDDLIVGFEAATDVSSGTTTTYETGDLARFTKTGSTCSSWSHAGPALDSTGLIEDFTKILGAAPAPEGDGFVLAFDIATCTCPPDCPLTSCGSPPTWEPRQLVKWDGTTFTEAEALIPGWPSSGSLVNALTFTPTTCPGLGDLNPGTGDVDVCARSWATADGNKHQRLEWLPTSGVDSYNVYRGMLSQDPMTNLECLTIEEFQDLQFVDTTMPPTNDGFYYLVTEVIDGVEGTAGQGHEGERVIPTPDRCSN